MEAALKIAGTGLRVAEHWLEVISHDVANAQTPGFKRLNVQFGELVSRAAPAPPAATETAAGPVNASGLVGLGARNLGDAIDFSDGALQATGHPLDLAIRGPGFIEVALPTGELAYARGGQLRVDAEGRLALRSGPVLTAQIAVPADVGELAIDVDGRVKGKVASSGEVLDLGQLLLARVADPSAMEPLGDGLYAPTERSGDALALTPGKDGAGKLLQGYVEASNADLTAALTDLMLAQRAFQLNARIIQAADNALEIVANLKR